MRSLTMPGGEKESQDAVLRQIGLRKSEGCVAHARVLLARDEGMWIPIGGRIDISRPSDRPVVAATPVGGARLLSETIDLDDLTERLAAAFSGGTFLIGGEHLAGHGMDGTWLGGRYTDAWQEYGVRWPVIEFAPNKFPARQPYLYDTYEAQGEVGALDGIFECVRLALGYVGVNRVTDSRGKRFGIYVWDYRGVFRREQTDGGLRFTVEPGNDPSLRLSLVARDDGGVARKTYQGPETVAVPLTGALHRLNMTLRHDDDIVCELLWDESTERFRLEHDGFYWRPPVAPDADPIDAGSTVAEAALPFMVDLDLSRMVARDLGELDSAVRAANVKSAVILAGSILEAVLLDVLGRNEHEARQRLGKKWPDRASAMDLIAAASAIAVALPDGTTTPLLPPLTGKKGMVVVDHRDLIHPRAEVRGAATIDTNTVLTMQGVLGVVLRDLREAQVKGVLDEYGLGRVV
jgi:hypothetical protein